MFGSNQDLKYLIWGPMQAHFDSILKGGTSSICKLTSILGTWSIDYTFPWSIDMYIC